MAETEPYNEKELLHKIAEGDEKAYKQLFTEFWGKIYVNALAFTKAPELARDLTQEVFIRIWIKRDKLITVEQFVPYLYRVAKNIFYDHFEKKVLHETNDLFLSQYFQDNSINAQENLELKELEKQIETTIQGLPGQVKTAFELSRKEGLTHTEIAERMGISRITSKSYISRAILTIKMHLKSNGMQYFFIFF